jgi:lipopolysaccharide export LptBFGC system permease protein LptF
MFIFGQTLSNEGQVSPFLGLWSANLILGFGGFMVYFLAVTERPLFRVKTPGKS